MAEPPNALMAINHELRRVEAQAGRRPLDPDGTENSQRAGSDQGDLQTGALVSGRPPRLGRA